MNNKVEMVNQGLQNLARLKEIHVIEEIEKPKFPENIQYPEFPKARPILDEKNKEVLLVPILIFSYMIVSLIIGGVFFDLFASVESFRIGGFSSAMIAFVLAVLTEIIVNKKQKNKLKKKVNNENKIKKEVKKITLSNEYILTKKELEEHYSLLKNCLGKDVLEEKIRSTIKKEGEVSGSLTFIQRLYENVLTYLKNEEEEIEKNKEFISQVNLLTKDKIKMKDRFSKLLSFK